MGVHPEELAPPAPRGWFPEEIGLLPVLQGRPHQEVTRGAKAGRQACVT